MNNNQSIKFTLSKRTKNNKKYWVISQVGMFWGNNARASEEINAMADPFGNRRIAYNTWRYRRRADAERVFLMLTLTFG